MIKNNQSTILMLSEYFYPFDRGGSEWSTYYLAKALVKKGYQIIILTPNYGSKIQEIWHKITIIRFPIGKKLKNNQENLTPFWQTNLFWFIQSFLTVFRECRRNKVDIIHVQGKYFLPAAVLAGRLTNKPIIFTARDYQILCSLGFCLWNSNTRCNLKNYLIKDFRFYLKNYLRHQSLLTKSLQFIFVIRHRLITKILYCFSSHVTTIVCTSRAQANIFQANRLKQSSYIYNTIDFPRYSKGRNRYKKQIIFAGRLTPGKGAHLLIPGFAKSGLDKEYKLLIIGEGILKLDLKQQIAEYKLTSRIKMISHVSHNQLLTIYSHSALAIFPSLWPESFGRGALEAIAQGIPVITSDRGALPEIIQKRYGVSVEPTITKLAQAIRQVINHREKFVTNISKDRAKLIDQFNHQPLIKYQRLYNQLIKD